MWGSGGAPKAGTAPPQRLRDPQTGLGHPKLGKAPQTGKRAPKLGRDLPNRERTHTKLGEELPKLGKDPLNWEMTLPNWERIPQTGQGPPNWEMPPEFLIPGSPCRSPAEGGVACGGVDSVPPISPLIDRWVGQRGDAPAVPVSPRAPYPRVPKLPR